LNSTQQQPEILKSRETDSNLVDVRADFLLK